MNITSTITSNPDRPMIPSEASGKRKASDDNSSNTNGALKPKRPRNDNSASNKRKLLNGEEQRSGLVIIRGSQSQPPSSQPSSNGSSALAGPSQPPNKRFRETPTNVPITKGKHRSPDEDGVVEEDTPKIEQNRAMRGEGSRTPRRASMSSRGKRLSNSFDRTGVITQPHPSELPDPDRARQLILLCAARAPRKLFQDMKDDLLLLLAERKIDLKGMRNDEPGSAANRGVEVRANEQNVNNRGRTTRFKDAIHLAKAEDDAWTAVGQFYNAYQESVMKELEQRQKAKGKQRADPEEDLRISELPEQFHNARRMQRADMIRTGHRWSELRYQTDELHTLVHTTVQMANAAETDLDRRFAHLSHILHTRTRPAAGPPTQPAPTSTFLPRRHADPSDSRDARPANQVSVAASRAAREVQRAQDAPASERRMTLYFESKVCRTHFPNEPTVGWASAHS
ncbi:hypothetical protein EDB83DRAFT_2418538 [Lactarius deliciosus]|nr:hypothetical protein EDB83DRAFT_2418538 [Lactarius deliciosus]